MNSNHPTLSHLLASLSALRVGIRVKGTGKDARLSVSAPSGVLTDEIKASINQWRPELLKQFQDVLWTEAKIVHAIDSGLTSEQVALSTVLPPRRQPMASKARQAGRKSAPALIGSKEKGFSS